MIYSEPSPRIAIRPAPLAAATLRQSGFARRTTGPQRAPHYDYEQRVPLLDTRHPRGWYSRLGPVLPLVERDDDAVAILGPGEDILLEFTAPADPLPVGWTRHVVLDTKGWCKDMDLFTKDGETVAPLPGTDTAERRALHADVQHALRRRPMSDSARTAPITPALRWLLRALYLLTGVLTATAVYLGGISLAEFVTGGSYQGYVYQWTVLLHLAVGLIVVLPFVPFALGHALAARTHPNRRAARMGYVLAALRRRRAGIRARAAAGRRHRAASTGRSRSRLLGARPGARWASRGPSCNHRRRGRALGRQAAWTWARGDRGDGRAHRRDRRADQPVRHRGRGRRQLRAVVRPHRQRRRIPAAALMIDDYCAECHADAHRGWLSSAHRFSSFNNQAYLASVKETREVVLERDGNVRGSRWCAGCHDPVPFFSGAFDDPKFDDRAAPDGAGRHHLHRLPRDHARQQHQGQRRLHDRRAAALPVRVQRQSRFCNGSTTSWSRPSRPSTRRRS